MAIHVSLHASGHWNAFVRQRAQKNVKKVFKELTCLGGFHTHFGHHRKYSLFMRPEAL